MPLKYDRQALVGPGLQKKLMRIRYHLRAIERSQRGSCKSANKSCILFVGLVSGTLHTPLPSLLCATTLPHRRHLFCFRFTTLLLAFHYNFAFVPHNVAFFSLPPALLSLRCPSSCHVRFALFQAPLYSRLRSILPFL
jgi:hypothetical protein